MGSSLWHGGILDAVYDDLSAIAEQRKLDLSNVPFVNQTAVFVGTIHPVWGHFITDCMRLLWFLRSKEYKEKYLECPVICLYESEKLLSSNYKRLLEILGIDFSKLIPITKLTKYKQIILPDECFFTQKNGVRYFTSEYVGMFDAVRDFATANAKPTKSDKVYFSYSRYKKSRIFGEDKLEKYFVSKGYDIIYPETLSLDEQLNILINAKSFASTVGSCSHNTLFLRDDTEVILIPRSCGINSYQIALNHVHRLNVHYVDSSFSIFSGRDGAVAALLYFVSSKLRAFFHDDNISCIVDASDFRKYTHSLGLITGDNPDAYKYYSNIAAEYFGTLFAMSMRGKFIRKYTKIKECSRNFLRKITFLRKIVLAIKAIKRELKIKR